MKLFGKEVVMDFSMYNPFNWFKGPEKTLDKYSKYVLWGLGLLAVIVVVDTVGDVLD